MLAGWELSRVSGRPPGTRVVARIHALGEPSFYAYDRTAEGWGRTTEGLREVIGSPLEPAGVQLGGELSPEHFVVE